MVKFDQLKSFVVCIYLVQKDHWIKSAQLLAFWNIIFFFKTGIQFLFSLRYKSVDSGLRLRGSGGISIHRVRMKGRKRNRHLQECYADRVGDWPVGEFRRL